MWGEEGCDGGPSSLTRRIRRRLLLDDAAMAINRSFYESKRSGSR